MRKNFLIPTFVLVFLFNSNLAFAAGSAMSKNSRLSELLERARQRSENFHKQKTVKKSTFREPEVQVLEPVKTVEPAKQVLEPVKTVEPVVQVLEPIQTVEPAKQVLEPIKTVVPAKQVKKTQAPIKVQTHQEVLKTESKIETLAKPQKTITKSTASVKSTQINNTKENQSITTTADKHSKEEVKSSSVEKEEQQSEIIEVEHEEESTLDEDDGLHEEQSLDQKENEFLSENLLNENLSVEEKQDEYLVYLKKLLKSLEEDSWNQVKFNMLHAVDFFEKEQKKYGADLVDKIYKLSVAFLNFAEGGLELDEGDFADFEEAESHYLDAQDILEDVELVIDVNNEYEKTLLRMAQIVKGYINEDLEYIEEMIEMQ